MPPDSPLPQGQSFVPPVPLRSPECAREVPTLAACGAECGAGGVSGTFRFRWESVTSPSFSPPRQAAEEAGRGPGGGSARAPSALGALRTPPLGHLATNPGPEDARDSGGQPRSPGNCGSVQGRLRRGAGVAGAPAGCRAPATPRQGSRPAASAATACGVRAPRFRCPSQGSSSPPR